MSYQCKEEKIFQDYRKWLIGMAMQALIPEGDTVESCAWQAVDYADAVLNELADEKNNQTENDEEMEAENEEMA